MIILAYASQCNYEHNEIASCCFFRRGRGRGEGGVGGGGGL